MSETGSTTGSAADPGAGPATDPAPGPTTDPAELRWILALLGAVVFMAVAAATMINVALPYIGQAFGASEGTYSWVVAGYSLSFGIFNAVNGRLADRFGLRRLYLLGLTVFGATALIVPWMPTMGGVIAARVLQGVGAAALPVLGSSIIARLVEARRRGAAMGVILSSVGVAASIGPFLGGLLVQVSGWRAVFYVMAIALALVPVGARLLPRHLDEADATSRFDLVGATLLGAGVALMLVSFEALRALGVGGALVSLLASASALGLFAWWIHRARAPFIPPWLLRDLRYVTVCAVAALCNATRFGTVVLVPIFLTRINGLAPLWVGGALLPGALAIALLSRRAGRIADRSGPRGPVTLGSICIILGSLLTAQFTGGSVLGVAAGMSLYGVGFAFIQTPLVSATSQLVPARDTGVGMGVFMMVFFIGGALGVALSATLVELQARGAPPWLPTAPARGGAFSNAIIALTGLALLCALLARALPPGRLQTPAA